MTTPAPHFEVITTVYIASGRKNGFYTLRTRRTGNGFCSDIYLRVLSTDPEKAEKLAREYFDRVHSGNPRAQFQGYADFDLNEWGTILEDWERKQIEKIEAGRWPFGKHEGQLIAETPDSYIRYWAEQEADASKRGPAMLIEMCKNIADEKGLFAAELARKAAMAAAAEADLTNSAHVGEVGARQDFELTLAYVAGFEGKFGYTTIQTFRDGAGRHVVYKGTAPICNGERSLERGETIKLKATIKAHGEFKGIKQTMIARAKVLEGA